MIIDVKVIKFIQHEEIMAKKRLEEKRRQNVVKATEDLLKKDLKYRRELNDQMNNKMERAESVRKVRLENLSRERSEQRR